MILRSLALAVSISFVLQGTAQNAPPASHLTAIRAERMVDVKSGAVIQHAVVLIDGDTIKAAGPALAIPAGARVIDLGNVTLLPGLIDCHTHLLQDYYNGVGDGQNIVTTTTLNTAQRAMIGVKNARAMLAAGFTGARDVGNSGAGADVALRNAIANGWTPGPRMAVSTRALSPVGGQFDGYPLSPETRELIVTQEYRPVTGTVEAVRAVREALYEGADLIKVIVGVGPNTLTVEEITAIVTEAHRAGRKVAAHATDDNSARIAATAGVDSIEHGYGLSEETAKLMASKKIFLVPTDGTVDSYIHRDDLKPELRQPLEDIIRKYPITNNGVRLQRAINAGVPIAAGSDYYYEDRANANRGQMDKWALHAYAIEGMPPIEILRATTINAAMLLGWQEHTGSIEPGKWADIIAVEGDPTHDINDIDNVMFVMKAGDIFLNRRSH
jgi:imidazolonepropionase-like amidohydrolase